MINKSYIPKEEIAQISSVDSITQTGMYIGSIMPGYSWQVTLALIQKDGAGVFISIDSINTVLFIGSKKKY